MELFRSAEVGRYVDTLRTVERAYDLGGAFEIGSEPDGTGTSAT